MHHASALLKISHLSMLSCNHGRLQSWLGLLKLEMMGLLRVPLMHIFYLKHQTLQWYFSIHSRRTLGLGLKIGVWIGRPIICIWDLSYSYAYHMNAHLSYMHMRYLCYITIYTRTTHGTQGKCDVHVCSTSLEAELKENASSIKSSSTSD